MHFGLINKHAAGAVHRLYCKIRAVDDGRIHIVFIMRPVTGALPERAIENHRSAYFNVAVSLMDFSPVFDESVSEHHSIGKEERETGTFLHYCKESELFAELAMVALFGFLKHIQISGKRFFCRVCRTVNSLQHFIL